MADPKARADDKKAAEKTAVSVEGDSGTSRRALLAGAVGTVATLAPLGVGAMVLFDPLREKPEDRQRPEFLEVCAVDDIPDNGAPVLKNVRADVWDQWTFTENDLLGSVYLRRDKEQEVPTCFNSICPHAGCRVSFNGAKDAADQLYVCPCHNGAFNMDGTTHGRTPSPRGMDELKCEVRDGQVWVQFKNFFAGKPDQVEKK